MNARARLRDERGFMGRLAVLLWLPVLAALVVIAIDVGSIALTQFKASNAADRAAFQAASEFKQSHDRSKAYAAALQVIRHDYPGASMSQGAFEIDQQTGDVTVKVVKRAWSIVAGQLSFTKPYVKVSATSTSHPPTL